MLYNSFATPADLPLHPEGLTIDLRGDIRMRDVRASFVLLLLFLIAAGHASMAFAQALGSFSATGNMTAPRFGHTATLLPGGKVLIAGGGSATVELYDPSTGTFTATGATTVSENVGSATLLPDGRVLLIEATEVVDDPRAGTFLDTGNAELYDPSTGSLSATGSMIDGQAGYTATLLTNGKVLITGGKHGETDCCAIAANPELYDPSTGMFSLAGPYADTGAPSISATYGAGSSGLAFTPATLLPDGKALISSESAAELYDPTSNAFSVTASMTAVGNWGGTFKPTNIYGRAATLLPNGKVLATGGDTGYYDTGYGPIATAELYDSLPGTFTATGNLNTARFSHAATLLPDGTVLITGGEYGPTPLAELYSPGTGAFFVAGNMNSGRARHQATLLDDGRVLITGGVFADASLQALASAELYTPLVLIPAPVLFSLSGDRQGQGAIWDAATGQVASATNPAVAGETLAMYTTSLLGGVIPPQVSFGGRLAQVLYFGASGYPGYYQVNFLVPGGVAPGPAVPVRLTYLGRPSNEVSVAVQ